MKNVFFVVSIGFDKPSNSDKQYKMTLKLAVPNSDPKNEKDQFILLSEEVNSITEATRLFKAETDKELDFTHAKVIILGEQLLEEDIEPIIDWSIRRRDIQGVAWVAIGKPSAKAVLALKPKSERTPSNALFLPFSKTGSESEFTVSTFLFDFFRKSYEKGFQAILPMIEIKESTFTIKKAVIFDKFVKKLILSPNETKLLNLLMTGLNKGSFIIQKDDYRFALTVDSAKSKYSIHNKANDSVEINLKVKVSGILEEKGDAVKPTQAKTKDLQKAAEQMIQAELTQFLLKLQKNDVDPIGFGLRYRSRHWSGDDEWAKWIKMYREATFQVNVKVEIQSTGLIN